MPAPIASPGRPNCAECGKALRRDNTLGYCRRHVYKSPVYRATFAKNRRNWWPKRKPESIAKFREASKRASAKWRAKNAERRKQIVRNWRERNPAKHRLIMKGVRDRSRATVAGMLKHRMSTRLRSALREKKAGRSWETLLGYTLLDLITHLETRFTDGMTWERFHKGEIHIDHIRPISMYQIEAEGDAAFKDCWALSNLQPLWASDHRKKSAAESAIRAKTDRLRDRHEKTIRRRQILRGVHPNV